MPQDSKAAADKAFIDTFGSEALKGDTPENIQYFSESESDLANAYYTFQASEEDFEAFCINAAFELRSRGWSLMGRALQPFIEFRPRWYAYDNDLEAPIDSIIGPAAYNPYFKILKLHEMQESK